MFPNIQNMFPHGGRGTEATVLLRFNNAKYKEEAGYLKSRTVASVPRPPTTKIDPPTTKINPPTTKINPNLIKN